MSQVTSTPRTSRGRRSKLHSSSLKGKSTGKPKKVAVDDSGTLPGTPSKKPKLDMTSPGLSALTAIAMDDSESEFCKGKYEEDVKLKLDTPDMPIKLRRTSSGSLGGTPTPVLPRIKREDPAAGSMMPIKRSIETSAEEQRKAMGIVQNMGVRMDLENGSNKDGDIA